ncbi:MAG: hypothetical protein E6Q58_01530 [Niabella sp.]|nr:MAG: hypothetical protein E6Q58_01530 [Niabella sp.]
MKFKYLFTLAFIAICTNSCKKQSNTEYASQPPIKFIFENAKGENLLNPATPGYFVHENIRKYDLINGEVKLYHQPNLVNHPYGYMLNNTKIGYIIEFRHNLEEELSPSTSYIDWGNGDRDTLVFGRKLKNEVNLEITDIWYNGKNVFNENNAPYLIKIVK